MADAKEILRKLLKKLFDNYSNDTHVKTFTTSGGNYTSALFQIEIFNYGDCLKLFAKVAILKQLMRDSINGNHLYRTEQYVFTDLVKVFTDLDNKYDIETDNRFQFPKYYGSNPTLGEETIIFEDLTENGYHKISRLNSMDWEHSRTLTAMAKFHSFSFAYKKEQPEEFETLIHKFTPKHFWISEANKQIIVEFNDNAIEVIDNDDLKMKLELFLKADESPAAYMAFEMPLTVPVLLHGDYRLSNLLFRRSNQSVASQPCNMADAELILRDLLRKQFINYNSNDTKVLALTTDGGNYTSALYKIKILDNDGKQLNLFGKIAIVNAELRDAIKAELMYSTEQYVYSNLIDSFKVLEDKYGIEAENRFKFPKCYGCNNKVGEETIILEDLTANGYYSYSRFESVDWEHTKISIANLAKFHSLTFAQKINDPEMYNNLIKKFATKEFKVRDENEKLMATFYKNATEVIDTDCHRRKLQDYFKNDERSSAYMEFRRPLSVPVLVHGDYRLSNLLFKRTNGELETIVVDYQTVHTGSPVSDLLYFIFTGTDEEFRRNYYEQLLDHYHNELALALSRYKIDINEVYPREVFESELKQMLPKALRMIVVILPIVTVEAANAPQVGAKDAHVSDFVLKPNELFCQRFNGLVRDCVRWGVI